MYVETFSEFRERMNCGFVEAIDAMGAPTYHFANGGRSDGTTHTPPPEDPVELATQKLIYVDTVMQQRIAAYEGERNHIYAQLMHHRAYPQSVMPPHPNWKQYLETLAAQIETLRVERDALQAMIPPKEADIGWEAKKQYEAEQKRVATEQLNELKNLPRYQQPRQAGAPVFLGRG